MNKFNKTITADVPTQSLLKELLIKDIKRLKSNIKHCEKWGEEYHTTESSNYAEDGDSIGVMITQYKRLEEILNQLNEG